MYRVVQITSASTGGIGRLTRDICDALPEAEFETHIAYARGKIFDSQRDYMFGSCFDVLVHGFMTRLTDRTGLYSIRATKELLRYMDLIKPDLIQLHNLHGYYINYEFLFDYIKKKKIPVVWTLHDCWAFTGHCVYFEAEKCYQWEKECRICRQLKQYPSCYTRGNTRENFNRKKNAFTGLKDVILVTPSVWLEEYVARSFLKEYQVQVIHNGINLNVFHKKISGVGWKAEHGIENQKMILGVASTWTGRKGFNDFIQISKMLPAGYKMVLVGISKEQKRNLPKKILGIEHTENPQELADIYNASDLFLNLTYEDNFPTTNLEALACGTPVLTYKTGGSVESITDKTGYIIEQGDIQQVLHTVINHEKTQKMSYACTVHAQEYDKYRMFGMYKKLYLDMIERK